MAQSRSAEERAVYIAQANTSKVAFASKTPWALFYKCPRCRYETPRRQYMVRHFERGKICPNRDGLELTDFIKETVLRDRIYHPPQNVTESWDEKFKISNKYIERQNVSNDCVLSPNECMKFVDETNKLYRKPGFVDEMFDRVEKIINKKSENWMALIVETGVKHFMNTIKNQYLNLYEHLLVRAMDKAVREDQKDIFLEYLEDYYKFISIFELEPVTKSYIDKYNHVKDTYDKRERREIMQKVLEIVRKNSNEYSGLINKQIMELFPMENTIKTELISLSVLPDHRSF